MNLLDVTNFATKMNDFKSAVRGEQHTKNVMVEPFLRMLGYDTANPFDVITEYTCDVGVKKGEKVDYAIMQNNNLFFLVEAKDCKTTLDAKHVTQLYRYYTTSKAKVAILTNGLQYRFYTDTESKNIMDLEPFFVFDLQNFETKDFSVLSLFEKDKVNVEKIKQVASNMYVTRKLEAFLKDQFLEPSDSLVNLLCKEAGIKKGYSVPHIASFLRDIFTPFNKARTDSAVQSEEKPSSKTKVVKEADPSEDITESGEYFLYDLKRKNVRFVKPTSILCSMDSFVLQSWADLIPVLLTYLTGKGKEPEAIVSALNLTWIRLDLENLSSDKVKKYKKHGDFYIDTTGSALSSLQKASRLLDIVGIEETDVLVTVETR